MNLVWVRANGAFRQSSSSIFGNPEVDALALTISGRQNLSERRGLESKARVILPPKMRETFADPPLQLVAGAKATIEREATTDSFKILPLSKYKEHYYFLLL